MPLCIFLHFFPQKRLNCKRFKKILVFRKNRFLPNQSTQLKSYFLRRISKTLFCVTAHNQKRRVIPKRQTAPRFFDGTHILFAKQPFALFCQKTFELTGKLSFVKHSVVFRAKKRTHIVHAFLLCAVMFFSRKFLRPPALRRLRR